MFLVAESWLFIVGKLCLILVGKSCLILVGDSCMILVDGSCGYWVSRVFSVDESYMFLVDVHRHKITEQNIFSLPTEDDRSMSTGHNSRL